jgi:tetratricopeptide (TPR) repeat protein
MTDDVEIFVLSGRLDRLLDLHGRAKSIAERRYLSDALERAVLVADPGSVSKEQLEALAALGLDRATLAGLSAPVPPHAVLLPFTTVDRSIGFSRLVYVARRFEWGVANELGEDARAAVNEAIARAASYVKSDKRADEHALVFAEPTIASRIEIEGRSLGAAAFVSAVALFSGRPVKPGTMITGELAGDHVEAVGGLAQKIEGCIAGRADLARVVVPSRNAASVREAVARTTPRIEVEAVSTLAALASAALGEAPGRREAPEERVATLRREFMRGWDGYRWPTQIESLERLLDALPAYRPDLRVEVLTMLGAVRRHLGAPDESLDLLERARAIVESEEGEAAVPDAPRTELMQHFSLTLQKLCRFTEAARAARAAIQIAERAHLRGELLKAHGCAGLVDLSRGEPELAVRHQRRALELVHAHRPSGCPRTHGYLIEALGEAHLLADARREHALGMQHLDDHGSSARPSREVWLHVSFAMALARGGEHAEVVGLLDTPLVREAIRTTPLPGLLARRLLGAALVVSSESERARGYDLLAAAPAAHGRGLLPHVRFLAHLAVLVEAELRAAHGDLDRDARARAKEALSHLPTYGDADRYLGRRRDRAARALAAREMRRDDATRKALESLLSRALRMT